MPSGPTSTVQATLSTNDDPNSIAIDEFRKQQELRQFKVFKHSKEGQDTLDWVNKTYTKMKSPMQTIKNVWYINLAMYYGQQYVDRLYTKTGAFSRIGTPQVAKHRVRAVTNLIRPMIRTELARMTSQKPTV